MEKISTSQWNPSIQMDKASEMFIQRGKAFGLCNLITYNGKVRVRTLAATHDEKHEGRPTSIDVLLHTNVVDVKSQTTCKASTHPTTNLCIKTGTVWIDKMNVRHKWKRKKPS